MNARRRIIWLLLLVLFQPSYTGAACNVTITAIGIFSHIYHVKCTLTSLEIKVPLTTHISEYNNVVTYVQSIDVSSSTINTVPVGVFQAFSGVVQLKMDNASINNIEPGALRGLTQLEELNLNHNNISQIQDGTFAELRHLVTLTMSNNRITSIPVGTFQHLGKVTTLDISFNNLTHLEFGFFGGLTRLQVLDMSDNNIAMLESKVLFPLISLTRLNLNGNLLSSFDVDTMVRHLTRLESINLDRNQIQCQLLTSYICLFSLRNIKVTGDSFKTKNVHGVYCVSDNVQRNSATHTQTMEDHNDHTTIDYNIGEAFRAENEKNQ